MPYIPLGQFGGLLTDNKSIKFGDIRSGTSVGQVFKIGGGTQGSIQSENYDGASTPDTTGWALFGDGSAFFGGLVALTGDIYSTSWDGTIPADLSAFDAGASAGYYLDASAGSMQLEGTLWMSGHIEIDGIIKVVDGLPALTDNAIWINAGATGNSLNFYDTNDVRFVDIFSDPNGFNLSIRNFAGSSPDLLFSTLYNGSNGLISMTSKGDNGGANAVLSLTGDDDGSTDSVAGLNADLVKAASGGAVVAQWNLHGAMRTKVNTLFPNEEISNMASITSFASTNYIVTGTLTLHTHSADTTVAVSADCMGGWGETGAVAYVGNIRVGISLDGGSTWSYGRQSESYVGTGTGGGGYRSHGGSMHYLEGTATGDVQVRMEHKVSNTSMDRITVPSVRGRVEQTF